MTQDATTPAEWFAGIPEWFGGFFSAIPDALYALWQFGDPSALGRGWWGVVIALIWGVLLLAVPLLIAQRTAGTHEWVSATMGVVASLSAVWWLFGVLPSAWIYYIDGSRELLEGTVIPASVAINFPSGFRLDIASNFYVVVRDLVVIIEHAVALALIFWVVLRVQARYPRGLAEGETKPDPGGYR